jgi:hypothetical protein
MAGAAVWVIGAVAVVAAVLVWLFIALVSPWRDLESFDGFAYYLPLLKKSE